MPSLPEARSLAAMTMVEWGVLRWVGPPLSRTVTTDGFRLWRWTEDDLATTPDLAAPAGTSDPGFAVLHMGSVTVAAGRNPGPLGRWLLDAAGPAWFLRDDTGLLQTPEGTPVGAWHRRTRGRVRDGDTFTVASAVYRPTAGHPEGRWRWTRPLTGLAVSDETGIVIDIGGKEPLTRAVADLMVRVRSDVAVPPALWAMTLGVLLSVWDAQAGALAG